MANGRTGERRRGSGHGNGRGRGHGIFSGGVSWSELHPATVVAVVFLLAYPSFTSDFFTVQIGAYSLILGTIALSLMMLAGYGGMVSLAQLTVAGFTAYLVAILGDNSVGVMGLGWPWWLTVPVAILAGAVLGALIGAIAVRTEGIYTIMITLAIAVVLFFFVRQNYVIFNGWTGFAGVEPPTLLGVYWRDPVPFYYLALAVAGFFFCAVTYISRSTFGLGLQAIRDNPRRMRALGFDVALTGSSPSSSPASSPPPRGCCSSGSTAACPRERWGSRGPSTSSSSPSSGACAIRSAPSSGPSRSCSSRTSRSISSTASASIPSSASCSLAVVLFSPDGLLGLWNRIRPRLRFDRNARSHPDRAETDAEGHPARVRPSHHVTRENQND